MNDMNQPITSLQDKSEFYLIMARAFMTPMTEESYQGMNEFLADDLTDLDQALGYGLTAHLDAYRAEMAKVANQQDLLIIYSRIFLQPPREAQINTGIYLDGAFLGGSVDEMTAFYRKFGVEKGEHFKEIPDHVSVQMEFVSYLYTRAAEALDAGGSDAEAEAGAGHYLHMLVRRWLPKFQQDLVKTTREIAEIGISANPYLPLANMLTVAVARDAAVNSAWVAEKGRQEVAIEKARVKHAGRSITPEDLVEIERKLKEKGLSTDHLSIPVEQRDESMGFQRKPLPSAKKG